MEELEGCFNFCLCWFHFFTFQRFQCDANFSIFFYQWVLVDPPKSLCLLDALSAFRKLLIILLVRFRWLMIVIWHSAVQTLNHSIRAHCGWFGTNYTMADLAHQTIVCWWAWNLLASFAAHIEHQLKLYECCISFYKVLSAWQLYVAHFAQEGLTSFVKLADIYGFSDSSTVKAANTLFWLLNNSEDLLCIWVFAIR